MSENTSSEHFGSLVPYATEAQAKCLQALAAEGGNFSGAARVLGLNRNSVRDAYRAAVKRAARRGFAPEFGWNGAGKRTAPINTVPDGFKLKGVSDLVDASGERERAWIKSTESPNENAHPAIPEAFIPREISEGKDGQGNTFARWTRYAPGERERWALMIEAAKEAAAEMRGAAGVTPEPLEAELDSDTMAVYGLGDPHIGMLAWGPETGEDFDLKIAASQTTAVVRRLIDSAPRSAVGLLVLVGDNFHADDDRQVTPGHGHKLTVDTRAAKVWRVGCRLWALQIREMLKKHSRVLVAIARGNHDPLTSFFMREWLVEAFANDPRVEILDNVAEHQYILFGGCLLGITHGHKTKPEGLVGVMSADVPEMWAAATACRHWITGHIHSKTWHDLRGCSLETLRTLAPADDYAAGAGYRSIQDSTVITFHKVFGEIGRQTVNRRRAGIMIEKHARGVKL
jgi:hypothetical protein